MSRAASQARPAREAPAPPIWLQRLAVLSFLLCAAALGLFDVMSVDLGWHLAAGELIWSSGAIPTHDVFSYLAEGSPWLDSHWLFQLMLFGAHELGGVPGLVVLRLVIVLAVFAVVFATAGRMDFLGISVFVCLLALFTSAERFVLRPELISMLGLAIFFLAAERFAASSS